MCDHLSRTKFQRRLRILILKTIFLEYMLKTVILCIAFLVCEEVLFFLDLAFIAYLRELSLKNGSICDNVSINKAAFFALCPCNFIE